MLGANSKGLELKLFGRPAAFLARHGVRPNAVTVVGTAALSVTALTLFPLGHLWLGAALLALIATCDALDGTLARVTGEASDWGAFLDSTLDRVSDAAIVAGLTIHLARQGHTWGVVAGVAALATGAIVPYARARAEALGYKASVGIAERSDRLIVTLIAAFLTGVGLPWWVLAAGLGLVAAGALATVAQRAAAVRRQVRANPNGAGGLLVDAPGHRAGDRPENAAEGLAADSDGAGAGGLAVGPTGGGDGADDGVDGEAST
ncbi:MAG: CDP-alcohol phosphatidyltransferase family protein [Bifidobacteriaceae bacterium]|nr:CDP-alcohol phosphatidyltransferase family protein [Bifidobacteriaceae bacterium]